MMATPKEEIDRQHQEAVQLVNEGIPCSKRVNHGEIPLKYKQRPTTDLFSDHANKEETVENLPEGINLENKTSWCDDDDDNYPLKDSFFPCWTSRGDINVDKLQELVQEGYNQPPKPPTPTPPPSSTDSESAASSSTHKQRTSYTTKDVSSTTNLWDEVNAAVNNVAIRRPSHDAWGIRKIALIFSDDFLQQTYELPWWHERPDIRQCIQPILNDVLEISDKQIVRLLLASLPPGVTIPIHQDSGEWVKHTHRVHVPIIVQNPCKILFRCGLTTTCLERIDCEPGHVFEINNQGKHAVSNCDTDYRVHLILDYVSTSDVSISRIQLPKGDVLLQTRRSIDRLSDAGKRPTPSFLILGTQKAGTTSLYEYMVQHPLIVRARRRETHCLDWRWNNSLKTAKQQRQWCHKFYYENELRLHPSCLTGDSTPSYLLDSRRVIPRIKQVFPWKLKFFVMLRDPIRRAESHYAMVTSLDGTEAQLKARGTEWRNKTFRQVVMEDLHKMKACGLIPYFDINTGTVNQEDFDAFAGSEQENEAWDQYLADIPLNTGSHSLLSRGLYELNLRPWFSAFDRSDFLVLSLERMKQEGIQSTMKRVWHHLDVPAAVEVDDDTPKNTREYDSLVDEELNHYLRRFFEPHNKRLYSILGGEEWRNVWL